MSRNPDTSPAHGNICAVGSERSDGGSREATGILSCGTNISYRVTPARRVWRARPCTPAGFRSHNEKTMSGQNGDWGDFYLCQRPATLLWMSPRFWCLDSLPSARSLCSLSAFPGRSSAVILKISWCPLTPVETWSSVAHPLSHRWSLQHGMEAHSSFFLGWKQTGLFTYPRPF